MASCITAMWSGTVCPQVELTVTQSSQTDTTVTFAWTLKYVTHGYTASTNGVGRDYTVKIDGTTVKTGTYDINGKSSSTIATGTHTVNKTTAARSVAFSVSFAFNITWSGVRGNTKTASGTIAITAKTSYAVKYSANGGSGAPSAQTKWHGTALTLSTTKPTRTGYSFQGWATSSTGSVTYASGASYTANAAVTLYAVWKANTYAVKYSANGGSGAPSAQTKTYGVTLKLSSIIPTRTNYNFLGWGKTSTATTISYAAGANYTTNAAITLYAVWELAYVKPRITNLSIARCESDGTQSDTGTYAHVVFNWACDRTVSSITITFTATDSSVSADISASGTSGSVDAIVGTGSLNAELTYTARLTVTDTVDYATMVRTLNAAKFVVDYRVGGTGVAFGKPAELDGVMDIAFKTRLFGGLEYVVLEPETDLNDVRTPNFYIGANVSSNNYANCPITSGTFTLVVASGGEDGQVKQSLTTCSKAAAKTYERFYYTSAWGEWVCTSDFGGTLLWSGAWCMTASQTATLSEPVSKQRSGIVLVFSRYSSSTAQNYHFNIKFIPKYQVAAHAGCGHSFMMTTDATFSVFATKYLYLHDTSIVGNDNNSKTGVGTCGITYENNGFVLRYVIGV